MISFFNFCLEPINTVNRIKCKIEKVARWLRIASARGLMYFAQLNELIKSKEAEYKKSAETAEGEHKEATEELNKKIEELTKKNSEVIEQRDELENQLNGELHLDIILQFPSCIKFDVLSQECILHNFIQKFAILSFLAIGHLIIQFEFAWYLKCKRKKSLSSALDLLLSISSDEIIDYNDRNIESASTQFFVYRESS